MLVLEGSLCCPSFAAGAVLPGCYTRKVRARKAASFGGIAAEVDSDYLPFDKISELWQRS
jgi:hypothetical protein